MDSRNTKEPLRANVPYTLTPEEIVALRKEIREAAEWVDKRLRESTMAKKKE